MVLHAGGQPGATGAVQEQGGWIGASWRQGVGWARHCYFCLGQGLARVEWGGVEGECCCEHGLLTCVSACVFLYVHVWHPSSPPPTSVLGGCPPLRLAVFGWNNV